MGNVSTLKPLKPADVGNKICDDEVVDTVDVDDTVGGVALPASPASGRVEVELQNLSDTDDIWIKKGTGVTFGPTGNGYLLGRCTAKCLQCADGVDYYGIADTGKTVKIKVIERIVS